MKLKKLSFLAALSLLSAQGVYAGIEEEIDVEVKKLSQHFKDIYDEMSKKKGGLVEASAVYVNADFFPYRTFIENCEDKGKVLAKLKEFDSNASWASNVWIGSWKDNAIENINPLGSFLIQLMESTGCSTPEAHQNMAISSQFGKSMREELETIATEHQIQKMAELLEPLKDEDFITAEQMQIAIYGGGDCEALSENKELAELFDDLGVSDEPKTQLVATVEKIESNGNAIVKLNDEEYVIPADKVGDLKQGDTLPNFKVTKSALTLEWLAKDEETLKQDSQKVAQETLEYVKENGGKTFLDKMKQDLESEGNQGNLKTTIQATLAQKVREKLGLVGSIPSRVLKIMIPFWK